MKTCSIEKFNYLNVFLRPTNMKGWNLGTNCSFSCRRFWETLRIFITIMSFNELLMLKISLLAETLVVIINISVWMHAWFWIYSTIAHWKRHKDSHMDSLFVSLLLALHKFIAIFIIDTIISSHCLIENHFSLSETQGRIDEPRASIRIKRNKNFIMFWIENYYKFIKVRAKSRSRCSSSSLSV